MTIAITGGNGFVGLALTEALQKKGRKILLFGKGAVPARFDALLGKPSFVEGDVTAAADLDQPISPDII